MTNSLPKRRPTLDEHLFGPGPKRILALDGGGTLGVIEIAFLEKIEKVLQQQHNDPDLRLCDYFDLIGGTSTGALIATALAMGKSAGEVKKIYFDMAEAVFKKRRFHIPGYHKYARYPFHARELVKAMQAVVGNEELQSKKLLTGLAIVTKRLDTASPWVLTNNPKAKYWEKRTEADEFLDNKSFKLIELLRASTAAPLAFNPKTIPIAVRPRDERGMPIGAHDEIGVFVDGALTPHNNPAMKLLMVAGIKRYGFGWQLGPDEVLLVSIGSGWFRPRINQQRAERLWAYQAAVAGARGAIWDAQVHTLMQLQWMSNPHRSWLINSEVADLDGDVLSVKGMRGDGVFSFQRYDLDLDRDWLNTEIPKSEHVRDITVSDLARLTSDTAFTDPKIMGLAYGLASDVARGRVAVQHFPEIFGRRARERSEVPEFLQRRIDAMKNATGSMRDAVPFVVGAVGHRWNKLPKVEIPRLRQQLADAFGEIQGKREAGAMVLMTGLAEGTDQLAARLALELGWALVGLLPFSREEFSKDFGSPAALDDFHDLIGRAQRIIEAPVADAYPDRNQGYAEQGRGLVGAADALVAIWDGQDAAGLGGTAEVIAAAIARGTVVYWISTEAGAVLRRL